MAPPSALDKAKQDRELIKVNLSYLETKLADHNTVPISSAKVNQYLVSSALIHERISDNYEKIVALADPADVPAYTIAYTDLLDRIFDVICGLEEIKLKFPVVSTSTTTAKNPQDVRLPRLELPSFNGNLQEWSSFRDMFKAAVHDNKGLSKAQKFTYLKSCLSGEANRLVQSLALCDSSYDIAWSQLTNRYQNDRELLFVILRKLFKQSSVQPQSAASLRTLIDVSKECIRSLEALKRPVEHWDDVLLFFMFQRLDQNSRELWEQSLKDSAIPPLKDFLEFLEQRSRALAAGGIVSSKPNRGMEDNHQFQRRPNQVHHAHSQETCKVCSNDHPIFKCPKFNSMPVCDRITEVKKHNLCFNCLREGHSLSKCLSKSTCRSCQGKHNTLIHRDFVSKESSKKEAAAADRNREEKNQVDSFHSNDSNSISQSMLATAVVKVKDVHNQHQLCRVLLDGGSTTNFITEACARRLGLKRSRTSAEVIGIASSAVATATGVLSLVMSPHFANNDSYVINALVLPKITGRIPAYQYDSNVWPHLQGLELADPKYNIPDNIDILVGSGMFWNLLLDGKKHGPKGSPIGIRSTLGWLIAGNLDSVSCHTAYVNLSDIDLDKQLKQFWELESVPSSRTMTMEETACEDHFKATHRREKCGRYVVKLPYHEPRVKIGSSRDIAIRRLKQLEKRLSSKPERQQQYLQFMDEYQSLGHMAMISDEEMTASVNETCYIPHHYVLKESSSTTKLRVVFDASLVTTSGKSLNDAFMNGPNLQDNLIDI